MKSLQNQKILVTREARGAKQLADKILAYGGRPIVTPLLEIACLPIQEEMVGISKFDWVFFTSRNGVACFLNHPLFARELADCQIAAVGTRTAESLERHGYHVDFIPSLFNAESMAAEFLATYAKTGSILLVCGSLSRPTLKDILLKAGRSTTSLEVYETVVRQEAKPELETVMTKENLDFVTFTSPSAVDAFIELLGRSSCFYHLPVSCIGTTTEKRAKHVGFTQTLVPQQFTIDDMLKKISEFVTG